MKIGFIGLGKLGLPCAAAMSVKSGEEIFGYDINPDVKNYIKTKKVPYLEYQIEQFLEIAKISLLDSISDVVNVCDLIFIAVQTPHESKFEGNEPVPDETKDFDYSHLIEVCKNIKKSLIENKTSKVKDIVIISTVLPGTIKSKINPIFFEIKELINLCYNPYFIAMGQTIKDFLNPEFILIGSDKKENCNRLINFYSKFQSAIPITMNIESAELTKVAYNTFIGFKISFANLLAEISSKIGGNVDDVTYALGNATDRLISTKYLRAGMADGGGCHPRDQIAMSWLAEDLNLSINPFRWLAKARDSQTEHQSKLIISLHEKYDLPIIILGRAYKANVNLTVGSPAILLCNFLKQYSIDFDCHDEIVDQKKYIYEEKSLFFIATNHDYISKKIFPPGSVCIDPWGDVINKDLNSKCLIINPGR